MRNRLYTCMALHCLTIKSQIIHLPCDLHDSSSRDICVLLGLILDLEKEDSSYATKWWFGDINGMICIQKATDFDLLI